ITWGAGRAAAHGPGQSPGTLHPLGSAPSPIAPAELYTRRIRPMLAKNCYRCHGEAKTSGLDMRTRDGMLRGGARGPALVRGNPAHVVLLAAQGLQVRCQRHAGAGHIFSLDRETAGGAVAVVTHGAHAQEVQVLAQRVGPDHPLEMVPGVGESKQTDAGIAP